MEILFNCHFFKPAKLRKITYIIKVEKEKIRQFLDGFFHETIVVTINP